EMPAPVKTTMRSAAASKRASSSIASLMTLASISRLERRCSRAVAKLTLPARVTATRRYAMLRRLGLGSAAIFAALVMFGACGGDSEVEFDDSDAAAGSSG